MSLRFYQLHATDASGAQLLIPHPHSRWSPTVGMKSCLRRMSLSVALLVAAPAVFATEVAWQLMSRHGECFPIKSLQRNFPDLGTIISPEDFVAFVQAKGLDVRARGFSIRGGSAVEVVVPGKELSAVFLQSRACPKQ